MSPEQYFPSSASSQLSAPFGSELKSPASSQQNNHKPPGRGPIPKFSSIKSMHEIKPRVNTQPPFRRANPEGGFISVSHTSPQVYIKLISVVSHCKHLQRTCRLRIAYATRLSNTSPRAIHVVCLQSPAKVSRTMGLTMRIAIIYYMSMTFWAVRKEVTSMISRPIHW